MTPGCGERLAKFVGDQLRFTLQDRTGGAGAPGWRAFLRTNLGRAELLRNEVVQAHFQKAPLAGASWRDVPMVAGASGWELVLPLSEVGFFSAKAYLLDPDGFQHWPWGPDFGVSVNPNDTRTANLIYCAFPRLFGDTRERQTANDKALEPAMQQLDEQDFTVIPPSGKLRDLTRQLPHIFGKLGCRILHLLPVNPTPTVFARFGRYGSPYAVQDLTAIDPALVEFDCRTTGLDQFQELVRGVHRHEGKLFLDLVINHTGWGAPLWENHPEWYRRLPNGEFESPGAWGNIWRDLVELDQRFPALWAELAEVFLTWCRRGVDGFRCDAGYKIPVVVWQHIIARVRQEYPETIFLLEGLGGAWEATDTLLHEGGMQWAYSELFQNYSGAEVSKYLDYALGQCRRTGLYVHYSETHDNARLAAKGQAWSLLRNRLCALASVSGGYGFTCGVEWLAAEKINVHGCTGLAWEAAENLVPQLSRLNLLLAEHPCFFDGAAITRLSAPESPVLALSRVSEEGADQVLILVNTDVEHAHTVEFAPTALPFEKLKVDLLHQHMPHRGHADHKIQFQLEPGAAYCLAATEKPHGLAGEAYRRARAQAAWAVAALGCALPLEYIGAIDWRKLAALVETSPKAFLEALTGLDATQRLPDVLGALAESARAPRYGSVLLITQLDVLRITPVPPAHWLLVRDTVSFRATLKSGAGSRALNLQSFPAQDGHFVAIPPGQPLGMAELQLDRNHATEPGWQARLEFLPATPDLRVLEMAAVRTPDSPLNLPLVLLTNGLGGMARLCVDLGRTTSKYDCVLGANLNPEFPVDRHVFAKRIRIWVNADGFITPLNADNLVAFEPGPPAVWRFVANAGDGRSVEIQMHAGMVEGRNATVLKILRPPTPPPLGRDLPAACNVRLTVRVDIEDRNFHWETHHNGGAEYHFQSHTHLLQECAGFAFRPAADRQLTVSADHGFYHHQSEWSDNLPHPVEQSRGMPGSGDGYSPGWFDLPLRKGDATTLILSAEPHALPAPEVQSAVAPRKPAGTDPLDDRLLVAARAFLVRRGQGKTVIAGYPWFLDWGRDTLICARGLLAAEWRTEVLEILRTFARFEQNGTLPNSIHGDNATNRDTTDAPLWFGVLCEDFAETDPKFNPKAFYALPVDDQGRTVRQVLKSIAEHYLAGTPNGIRVDLESGLVWSPSHFTWMDTNFPAGTPREGYPVEIQALWIRLLRQLHRLGETRDGLTYAELAARAEHSFTTRFWLEQPGWLADVLLAKPGVSAANAVVDHALRSNALLAVSLGLLKGEPARRCVEAARQYLLVPGAVRSLAPLPAQPPYPIHAADGRLLNNPAEPYWGRYEGDEDTRRKPAYHNGTAWTWTLPVFCEALVRAYERQPEAIAAARAYLGGMAQSMSRNCLGQIPEILDGDAPHQARGCDAQAWGVTETLRVWRWLGTIAS